MSYAINSHSLFTYYCTSDLSWPDDNSRNEQAEIVLTLGSWHLKEDVAILKGLIPS